MTIERARERLEQEISAWVLAHDIDDFARDGLVARLRTILEALTPTNDDAVVGRAWEPHERNYSGGRFGVWHNDEFTVLRVEAGIADATASITKGEAWDLAQRLSPALVERMEYLFGEMKKAQHALHQFTWADTLSPLLRKIADDWDCDSSQCEFASSDMGGLSCPLIEGEQGCRAVEADELRQFADALETRAALASIPPLPNEARDVVERLETAKKQTQAARDELNSAIEKLVDVHVALIERALLTPKDERHD